MINPICSSIPILGYLHHAFPLSVLLTNEKAYKWLYNNYIQLVYYSCDGIKLNFYTNTEFYMWENIISRRLDKKIIRENQIDLIELFKNSINEGYYIQVDIDEFFLSNRDAYNNFHRDHEILIFGYNSKQEVFYTCGYNKMQLFTQDILSYSELLDAFNGIEKSLIVLFKNDPDYYWHTDPRLIYELINDYIHSTDTSQRYRYYRIPFKMLNSEPISSTKIAFGIAVYDKIIEHTLSEKKHDIRVYHILMEHKTVMYMRIKYLIDIYKLDDTHKCILAYEKIVKASIILKNLMLKNAIVSSDKAIKRAIDILINMRLEELSVLSSFKDVVSGLFTEY